ncbi:MAG: EpsI family protein [Sedimentisphaerales bacterium]|nr:EpsI family protein [Sedimentisphaerales bacterium]
MAYLFENKQLREPVRVFRWMCGAADETSVWFVWVLALLLLVSAGIAYRVPAYRLKLLGEEPVALPVPLSNFPTRLGNWVGTELPIPATTREYMERNFADDFFSRRYVNSADKTWADVYVVYCSARPGGILGHRPSVCYPAHGWLQESTETSQFTSQYGRRIDCLVQRFRRPAPAIDEVVVLSFYVRNGQITTKESDFSGLFGRKFNIARDPSRYVAQVQISSALESSVRKAVQEVTTLVLDFLPDENGKVKAATYRTDPTDSAK